MFSSALNQIRSRNGMLASCVIFLLYLEKRYSSSMLKTFRKFLWQPLLNLQIHPNSFDSLENILTLHLTHPFMIIIHEYSKIGNNCTIYHECTIGLREHKSLTPPRIGNNVFIGCKSLILGDVFIGDNTRIGAGSIILATTPPCSTITGLYKAN